MPYWHSSTSLCMGNTLLTWPLIPIGLLYSNSHFDQIWCVASIGGGVNKIRNSWPPPSEWNLIDVNNMQFFSLIKKELYIRIFFFKGWGRVHNFEKSHSHFIILIFDNKSVIKGPRHPREIYFNDSTSQHGNFNPLWNCLLQYLGVCLWSAIVSNY